MKKQKLTSLEVRMLEEVARHKGPNLDAEKLARVLGLESEKVKRKLEISIGRLVSKGLITVKRGGIIRLAPAQTQPGETPSDLSKEPADTIEGAHEIREIRAKTPKSFEGNVSINRYGTGFLTIIGRETDVRIPQRWLGLALNGDRVEVTLHGHRGSEEGRVERILERSGRMYTGTISQVGRDSASIRSDERSAHVDFWVPFSGIKKAQEGDRVIFKLAEWENRRGLPKAEIVDVLGKAGTNDADVLSILAENQFLSTFPAEVEHAGEQAAVPVEKEDLSTRLDLRDKTVFTIDPVDAKDFDDALHIERLGNGHFSVGVHIADVTHYVKPDTLLDKEGRNRATSVYLVDRVIPMLPEALSNGICSLNPHVDRLAFSCIMEVDDKGTVFDYRIDETVIHSKFRFSYESAQDVLDGADHEIKADLLLLNSIAKELTAQRMLAGAIDFDSPEPRFVLNERKEPVEIIIKERKDSNRLIEEWMLMANKMVSIHIENLRKQPGKKVKHGYPFLYRVHAEPNDEKLRAVDEFLKPLGLRITGTGKKITSIDLQQVLLKIKGTPYENIVNQLVLRSMAKAEYTPVNIGHFGLHFDFYTHFTSPIRRYPDVLVHRMLKSYASGKAIYTEDQLAELGRHTSQKERDAQIAERDSIKLKQVEYLSKRPGYLYDGVISGITENGIYVEMRPTFIEGMIRLADLQDDFYVYDRERHTLFGKRRGKKYILGQTIRVKVVRTDISQRTIDILPV